MAKAAREQRVVLSTLPATSFERRLAFATAGVSLVVFAALVPFAQVKLTPVPAFIPLYQASITIIDVITVALLFGQYRIERSPALLVLACAYVFTALLTMAHTLSFPGLFSPTGLFGAGPQTTAWLYMAWHAVFPLCIAAYAWLSRRQRKPLPSSASIIIAAVAATVVIAGTFVSLSTLGHDLLPPIMAGSGYTSNMILVVGTVWIIGIVALVALWSRRTHSVLDVWLMVVMCVWLCEVALSALLNAGRFDLGFYAGRIYGLLAASFVLMMLLSEVTALYDRVAQAQASESEQRERHLSEMEALLAHAERLNELSRMTPALAHELNQPLTAVGNYLEAARAQAQAGKPEVSDALMRKAVDQVHRAGQILARLRAFLVREESEKSVEDVRTIIEEACSLALIAASQVEIDIRTDLDPAAAGVIIDKVQIEQVLTNLIRNAIEAMSQPSQRILSISSKIRDRMVEISVADNGSGLAPEVRERLFQAFSTTKRSGMGVGLSICRVIIEAHGGKLWAEDNVGGGTVFRFTLPAADSDLDGWESDATASLPSDHLADASTLRRSHT